MLRLIKKIKDYIVFFFVTAVFWEKTPQKYYITKVVEVYDAEDKLVKSNTHFRNKLVTKETLISKLKDYPLINEGGWTETDRKQLAKGYTLDALYISDLANKPLSLKELIKLSESVK